MQRMAVAAVLGFSVGALVNLWNLPWIDRMSYVLIFTGVTGLSARWSASQHGRRN